MGMNEGMEESRKDGRMAEGVLKHHYDMSVRLILPHTKDLSFDDLFSVALVSRTKANLVPEHKRNLVSGLRIKMARGIKNTLF